MNKATLDSSDKLHTGNNFDILRLALALVVLFYHIRILARLGDDFVIPLSGGLAVKMFFVISGYLIFKSFINSRDIKQYNTKSRLLRILPLYYVSLVTFFIISAFISTVNFSEFLTQGGIRHLVFNALFLNFVQPGLPGVFQDQVSLAINGSLWTLKIELGFYVIVPILVILFEKLKNQLFQLL